MDSTVDRMLKRTAFNYGARVTKKPNPSDLATKEATRTGKSFDSSTYLRMRKMNAVNRTKKILEENT